MFATILLGASGACQPVTDGAVAIGHCAGQWLVYVPLASPRPIECSFLDLLLDQIEVSLDRILDRFESTRLI